MSGEALSYERCQALSEGQQREVLADVAQYYSAKLVAHGATPSGVDWNGRESQELRFRQLLRLFESRADCFSVNDLGCGYGALYDDLAARAMEFEYCGADISAVMIERARLLHAGAAHCRFVSGVDELPVADYTVASGIFNVKLAASQARWNAYVAETLRTMDRLSRSGFAFNCLTHYSDRDKMLDRLYYAEPAAVFDFCKRNFSRNVALLHDYGLYEFTILVRKDV